MQCYWLFSYCQSNSTCVHSCYEFHLKCYYMPLTGIFRSYNSSTMIWLTFITQINKKKNNVWYFLEYLLFRFISGSVFDNILVLPFTMNCKQNRFYCNEFQSECFISRLSTDFFLSGGMFGNMYFNCEPIHFKHK